MPVQIKHEDAKNKNKIYLAAVKDWKGKEKFKNEFEFKPPADHWFAGLNTHANLYVTAEKDTKRAKVTLVGSQVGAQMTKSVVGFIPFL